MFSAKKQVEKLLKEAGITINGPNDFDIKVLNEKVYARVLTGASLGLGESYMDGWWQTKQLDQFFYKIFKASLDKKVFLSLPLVMTYIKLRLFNEGASAKAFEIAEKHYDAGNDLYEAMLDKRMVYTCGYWKNATTLDEAQEAKLDLVCKKLKLKKGDRVLDVGCGWGSFLKFAAQKYGIVGVGVTVSKEQVDLARKLCEGLPIEIVLQDYRDMQGQFDHIVSLGMFEHVGVKNYRTYMQKAYDLLKPGGLFLLHTIGANYPMKVVDPWVEKYIFPNSILPSIQEIGAAIQELFIMEDWQNFGADYDKTLMAWWNNFDKAWPRLKGQYSERFYRMWSYYLLSFAAVFRTRNLQLWQVVLSKKGAPGRYDSVR